MLKGDQSLVFQPTVPVAFSLDVEAVLLHDLMPQYDWQVLVECDELPHCCDDPPCLLVQPLPTPVRVHQLQPRLDAVVLSGPHQVLCRKPHELVNATIAWW